MTNPDHHPVTPEHYRALGAFVAYALRTPTQEAEGAAFVEDMFGELGFTTYGDLRISEDDAIITMTRAAIKDAGLKTSGMAFKQLMVGIQLVTLDTPICEDCGKLAIINEAGWKVVIDTNCPHCGGLVEQLDVKTTHTAWTTGREVPLAQLVDRNYVPDIPLTDEGIEGYLSKELSATVSPLFVGSLVRICNILWAHPQYVRIFSDPTQVLQALTNPTGSGIARSQIRRVKQILRENTWYQRTPAPISQPASQTSSSSNLSMAQLFEFLATHFGNAERIRFLCTLTGQAPIFERFSDPREMWAEIWKKTQDGGNGPDFNLLMDQAADELPGNSASKAWKRSRR